MYNRDSKLTVSANEKLKKEAKANLGPDETLSDRIEKQVLEPLAKGKTKKEMIKEELEREKQRRKQKERVRAETDEEIKESSERIQYLRDRLESIEQEQQQQEDTYEGLIQSLADDLREGKDVFPKLEPVKEAAEAGGVTREQVVNDVERRVNGTVRDGDRIKLERVL